MLSKVVKLPAADIELLKQWFSERDNIIKCLPNVKSVENNNVIVDLGFFSPKIKFKMYTLSNGKYVEQKLLEDGGERKLRIILLLSEEPELRVIYEGDDENKLYKILDDLLENIKKSLSSDLAKNRESKNNTSNFSKELMKASFLSKLISTSKLLLEEEKELNDVLEYIETILERFRNYSLIYIRGLGENSFRVLFMNGELKGVYIRFNNEDSFNELDLIKLKGKFQIRVYGRTSPILL